MFTKLFLNHKEKKWETYSEEALKAMEKALDYKFY